MCSKLKEEKNLRKVDEVFDIMLTKPNLVEKYFEIMQSNSSDRYVHCYSIDILNPFDPELQVINTKPMMKNKLKDLLS